MPRILCGGVPTASIRWRSSLASVLVIHTDGAEDGGVPEPLRWRRTSPRALGFVFCRSVENRSPVRFASSSEFIFVFVALCGRFHTCDFHCLAWASDDLTFNLFGSKTLKVSMSKIIQKYEKMFRVRACLGSARAKDSFTPDTEVI